MWVAVEVGAEVGEGVVDSAASDSCFSFEANDGAVFVELDVFDFDSVDFSRVVRLVRLGVPGLGGLWVWGLAGLVGACSSGVRV